jgi:hypothetical protein
LTLSDKVTAANDYWPNTLFDTRQALVRDTVPTDNVLLLGGVMHHVVIDVGNLARCTTVYAAPTRNYSFDTDFLNPAKPRAAAAEHAAVPRPECCRLRTGAESRPLTDVLRSTSLLRGP